MLQNAISSVFATYNMLSEGFMLRYQVFIYLSW